MIDSFASILGVNMRTSIYKVLAKLGLGIVTFGGFQHIYDQLLAEVTGLFSSAGGPVLQLLTLSGTIDGLGIVLGAVAVKVSLLALGKFGVLPA